MNLEFRIMNYEFLNHDVLNHDVLNHDTGQDFIGKVLPEDIII